MPEGLVFHFEGALADSHRMNFYESARFQYDASRLLVKLSQFRQRGEFRRKITDNSNFNIDLISQSDGSFNINVESSRQSETEVPFIKIPLEDLLAYVSERIIGKIDDAVLVDAAEGSEGRAVVGAMSGASIEALDELVSAAMRDEALIARLSPKMQELIKRRVAEIYRANRLVRSEAAITKIDHYQERRLISMAAPLLKGMSRALWRSANTLEVRSSLDGRRDSVLFLDKQMAREIETAIVDDEITPILCDVSQFNKDNGWGKLKINDGSTVLSFNVPYDILPTIKQRIIDSMKRDLVYLQTYFVRDRSGEVSRLIVTGILPTPLT